MRGKYVSTQNSILGAMKARACILIMIWSMLLIEPATANFNIESNYSACKKSKKTSSSCSQSSCDNSDDREDENDCEGNRCNPIMSCPTGNFYLFNQPQLSLEALKLSKEKQALINDNRIVEQMAECWHPPEII